MANPETGPSAKEALKYWVTVEVRVLAAKAKSAAVRAVLVEADARRLRGV